MYFFLDRSSLATYFYVHCGDGQTRRMSSLLRCCDDSTYYRPVHSLLVVHPTNALIVVCGFFGIGCLDSFKRPTPHPLTKRGIENIFDVPVLHLGVWVRIVDLNPHMFGTTPTVSLLLSGRLHRTTSLYTLSCREVGGDDEQEPRSSART